MLNILRPYLQYSRCTDLSQINKRTVSFLDYTMLFWEIQLKDRRLSSVLWIHVDYTLSRLTQIRLSWHLRPAPPPVHFYSSILQHHWSTKHPSRCPVWRPWLFHWLQRGEYIKYKQINKCWRQNPGESSLYSQIKIAVQWVVTDCTDSFKEHDLH